MESKSVVDFPDEPLGNVPNFTGELAIYTEDQKPKMLEHKEKEPLTVLEKKMKALKVGYIYPDPKLPDNKPSGWSIIEWETMKSYHILWQRNQSS